MDSDNLPSSQGKLATGEHLVDAQLKLFVEKTHVCIPFHTPYIIISVVVPMRYIKLILFQFRSGNNLTNNVGVDGNVANTH